jgi:chromosome segregation ATPase
MTDDRATLNYQDFIEEAWEYKIRATDQFVDFTETLTTLLKAATDAQTQFDRRIEELVAQVDALTAERDALIRDRDRWAAEAQVNTSPIVAGLTAENERRRQRIQNQTDQINALERSRRRLESLMAGADRRVAVVEAENTRLREAVVDAYIAGAMDVHHNWQADRAPDFSEAARDYAAALNPGEETE